MGWRQKRAEARSTSEARRSKFEVQFEKQLQALGVEYVYEATPTYFTPPPKVRRKTFDWHITLASGKKIIIETKGYWDASSRTAETMAIEQNPDLDIRYVFMNSNMPIRKGSNTTYAVWCRKHGILYADGGVPRSWLDE
jgi:hypothetical protein